MTGYLDEATETWTDLDEMLAAELPPCLNCDKPPVTVVRVRCLTCPLGGRIGLCAWHLKVARASVERGVYPMCPHCAARHVRLEGLS